MTRKYLPPLLGAVALAALCVAGVTLLNVIDSPPYAPSTIYGYIDKYGGETLGNSTFNAPPGTVELKVYSDPGRPVGIKLRIAEVLLLVSLIFWINGLIEWLRQP